MAPDLSEVDLRQRAERLLRAFDFARCLEVLKRFGRSAGNAAARRRDPGLDEHDLRALARRTYRFSNGWRTHVSAIYFSLFSYNFCWLEALAARASRDPFFLGSLLAEHQRRHGLDERPWPRPWAAPRPCWCGCACAAGPVRPRLRERSRRTSRRLPGTSASTPGPCAASSRK
jgi:hypothetical protein